MGNLNVNFPLNIDSPVQFNKYPGQKPDETISVIVPIISNDNRQQIGYVRITQYLDPLVGEASPTENRTFHQLDIGLASGRKRPKSSCRANRFNLITTVSTK